MTFIVTLISLVIERFFHWSHLRRWRWFNTFQQWLSHSSISRLPSFFLLIIALLPLTLFVGFINYLLNGWLYGILKLLFGVAVLLYCMGPSNFWVQTYRCINQFHKEEDPNAAMQAAQTEFGFGPIDSSQEFHLAFTRNIFIAAYDRVFAVVFWFVLLGPVGAVLYRSIALMRAGSPLGLMYTAKIIQQLLDWIPIRMLTFIFALGGHFARVFARWKKTILKGPETNDAMLADCGIAALDVMEGSLIVEDGSAEREALLFLDRVFVMGLVILAVVVLIL